MKREFSLLTPIERLAAQIIDRLHRLGSQTTKRELERSMSAHKRRLWKEAWEMLIRKKCIQLIAGKRRKQVVHLMDNPKWSQSRPTAKKPKRKRPQSEWFKFWLPMFLMRDGYVEQAAQANAELEQEGFED